MPFRFFVDQCLPRSLAQSLSEKGHEIFYLRNHLPVNTPDNLVIKKAVEMNCILLSDNSDFANIVQYPPDQFLGIISCQIKIYPEGVLPVTTTLLTFLNNHSDQAFFKGKLCIIEIHRVRIVSTD